MDVDYQLLEDAKNLVRVAVDPSVLDRCLCVGGEGRYYFYDDVTVPFAQILDGADRPLLPSQKERLVRLQADGATEDCGEGEVFGCLWMRFCARLAEANAGFFRRERRRLCLLGVAWFALNLILVLVISGARCDEWPVVVSSILVVLNVCPMVVRLSPITEGKVQEIVDEMAPSFEQEGFHVDLVASSMASPVAMSSPMYVRFERVGSSRDGAPRPSMSLSESMLRFQERARRNYRDAAIDQRQAKLRERGLGPVWICCVPLETLEEWKPALVGLTIVLGFTSVMLWIALFVLY